MNRSLVNANGKEDLKAIQGTEPEALDAQSFVREVYTMGNSALKKVQEIHSRSLLAEHLCDRPNQSTANEATL